MSTATMHVATIAGLRIGGGEPLALLAGPCVVESREMVLRTAGHLAHEARRFGMPLVFKSSFKKANRTSLSGFTGLGRDEDRKSVV